MISKMVTNLLKMVLKNLEVTYATTTMMVVDHPVFSSDIVVFLFTCV